MRLLHLPVPHTQSHCQQTEQSEQELNTHASSLSPHTAHPVSLPTVREQSEQELNTQASSPSPRTAHPVSLQTENNQNRS